MSWVEVVSRAGALALLAAVGIGCGDDVGRFDQHVADVRAAVDDGDHEQATRVLEDLALAAFAAHEDGAIDDAELEEITGLIDSSRHQLDQLVPPETTSNAPPTTPAPTTTAEVIDPPDDDDDDDENEKNKGNRGNKDKDKDDDDD